MSVKVGGLQERSGKKGGPYRKAFRTGGSGRRWVCGWQGFMGGWVGGREDYTGLCSPPLPNKNPLRAATPKLWSVGAASNLTRQPISDATIRANTGIIQ